MSRSTHQGMSRSRLQLQPTPNIRLTKGRRGRPEPVPEPVVGGYAAEGVDASSNRPCGDAGTLGPASQLKPA